MQARPTNRQELAAEIGGLAQGFAVSFVEDVVISKVPGLKTAANWVRQGSSQWGYKGLKALASGLHTAGVTGLCDLATSHLKNAASIPFDTAKRVAVRVGAHVTLAGAVGVAENLLVEPMIQNLDEDAKHAVRALARGVVAVGLTRGALLAAKAVTMFGTSNPANAGLHQPLIPSAGDTAVNGAEVGHKSPKFGFKGDSEV